MNLEVKNPLFIKIYDEQDNLIHTCKMAGKIALEYHDKLVIDGEMQIWETIEELEDHIEELEDHIEELEDHIEELEEALKEKIGRK